jgi:hypothetical protein
VRKKFLKPSFGQSKTIVYRATEFTVIEL